MYFLVYVIEWSHSLATSNTILLTIHWAYVVLRNTWDFCNLFRLQTSLWHIIDIVSILLRLPLWLVVLCHMSHSSFWLATLSLIKIQWVFIFLPILGIGLLQLHVLKHWFPLWIFLFSSEAWALVDWWSYLLIFQIHFGVLLPISILSFLWVH